MKHAVLFVAVCAAACGAPAEAPGPAIVYLPCGSLVVAPPAAASPMQRDAVAAGLELWNSRGLTRLSSSGEGEPIALSFQPAASLFHGLYDPKTGEVLINDSMDDPAEISIVVAHELGHAMGLQHVDARTRPSVMNPGNVTLGPTEEDNVLLSGRCNQL